MLNSNDIRSNALHLVTSGGRITRFLRSAKFGGLFGLFVLVVFFFVPAIYTFTTEVPPIADLKRSEGLISFTTKTPRSGYRLILQEANGMASVFSCKDFALDPNNCLSHESAGKKAVVYWYEFRPHPFGVEKHPAKIEINGNVVLTYERTKERLSKNKERLPALLIGVTTAFALLFAVLIRIERRTNEKL